VPPETRYARNGDVQIAYQTIGSGPPSIAWVPWLNSLEVSWEEPLVATFFEKLGTFARVIRHDRRGTGLSDRTGGLADLETQVDDLSVGIDAGAAGAGDSRGELGLGNGGLRVYVSCLGNAVDGR
jgi:pimeloyl-ACP methyl ester carboxylesterase